MTHKEWIPEPPTVTTSAEYEMLYRNYTALLEELNGLKATMALPHTENYVCHLEEENAALLEKCKEIEDANSNCISLTLHEARMKNIAIQNSALLEKCADLQATLELIRSDTILMGTELSTPAIRARKALEKWNGKV